MRDEPGTRTRPALSPSRAADFKQCPLLYRFRAIDRLPEPPSTAQLRGSVVHAALEQLYGLPPARRGHDAAMALVAPAWEQLVAGQPALATALGPPSRPRCSTRPRVVVRLLPVRGSDPVRPAKLRTARRGRAGRWHAAARLYRPHRRRAHRRAAGGRLQDRQGTAGGTRACRVQGLVPDEVLCGGAAALAGVLPTRLRLIYLADGELLDYSPEREELLRFEKTLMAIWRAIQSAGATGDFRSRPSRLCEWCPHQQHCPEFGGTPPPYPGWPAVAAIEPAGPANSRGT
ncbi:PD-(D/E)XK nuclease superfamily protein [Mycobacterium xenopi 3993]|nr:PD-(D/E)XK nuclease superfamily protein [Mycobacterium xenopi 3993]